MSCLNTMNQPALTLLAIFVFLIVCAATQLFFILSHVVSSLISPWCDPKKLADSWWSPILQQHFIFFFLVLFDLKWFYVQKASLTALNRNPVSRFMVHRIGHILAKYFFSALLSVEQIHSFWKIHKNS